MTHELRWLCYTAILAASLWIPYIVGINVTDFEGKNELFIRPPDHSKMRPWVHRSLRAHQNLLEQLLPFSAIVLIGAVAGVSTPVMGTCAAIFFWLRVAHAAGMVSGSARLPIRPMIYFSGWIVTVLYAWQVLAHAIAK
jgi:uncharacterized MAPEG superfamily protein